jgi:hypothetical protein
MLTECVELLGRFGQALEQLGADLVCRRPIGELALTSSDDRLRARSGCSDLHFSLPVFVADVHDLTLTIMVTT